MTERGKFAEPYPATELHKEISSLTGFDRMWYIYGRILQTTRGTSIKALGATTKKVTVEDSVSHYLKKVNAYDFNSGLSAKQVAGKVDYGRTSVSEALTKLAKKGLVISEQRGRRIKYYLPSQSRHPPPEEQRG